MKFASLEEIKEEEILHIDIFDRFLKFYFLLCNK